MKLFVATRSCDQLDCVSSFTWNFNVRLNCVLKLARRAKQTLLLCIRISMVILLWLKFGSSLNFAPTLFFFLLQVQLPFKMQAAHDAAQFAGTTSNLATVLQYLCVWGQISWSVGQQIARAAELDSEAFDV